MSRPTCPRGEAGRGEAGSSSIEILLLTPAFLFLVALGMAAMRISAAEDAVAAAAADAARTASIAREPGYAHAASRRTAAATLASEDLTCSSTSVRISVAGFATRVGQPGQVTASVSCTVPLSDLGIPGLSATRRLTARASSPIDTYRERR